MNPSSSSSSSSSSSPCTSWDTALTAVPHQTQTLLPPVEKSKRKQVKNACVNCQKACKKCDDGRPCKRCIKLGLTATCRDSDRKERKKGVKRGPYKKRQAYPKDKQVFPKLLTEAHQWDTTATATVITAATQQLSTLPMQLPSIPLTYQDAVVVVDQIPSFCMNEGQLSLSPTSSNSFVDESDETLHYAYGYRYTNNTTITTTSSPSASSMLDHHHQAITGNVTPLQDEFYSWDDISATSPIGYNPITIASNTMLSDPTITTATSIQKEPYDFLMDNYWFSMTTQQQQQQPLQQQPLQQLQPMHQQQLQQQQQQQPVYTNYNIPQHNTTSWPSY